MDLEEKLERLTKEREFMKKYYMNKMDSIDTMMVKLVKEFNDKKIDIIMRFNNKLNDLDQMMVNNDMNSNEYSFNNNSIDDNNQQSNNISDNTKGHLKNNSNNNRYYCDFIGCNKHYSSKYTLLGHK